MLAAAMLVGCGQVAKEEAGALIGAGLGGLAGSFIGDGGGKLVAVGVGTMLGAIIGGETGKSLDRADKFGYGRRAARGIGVRGFREHDGLAEPGLRQFREVVPQPAFRQADGTYCREFQQTIIVGAEMVSAYGIACRQPDGTWKLS